MKCGSMEVTIRKPDTEKTGKDRMPFAVRPIGNPHDLFDLM